MDADLTLRRDSRSGGIRRRPTATNKFHYQRLRRIILIHGFNSAEDSALEGYDKFKTYSTIINQSFGDQMVTLAWPGDRWVLNPVSYYRTNIESAKECARALAEFIVERNSHEEVPCEYVLIAHSLGCRLVVLLLEELSKRNAPLKQFKIFLMAAAIPVGLLAQNSSAWQAVGSVAMSAVLHSPNDGILQTVFRAGEPAGFWTWPEAVGLYGSPRDGLWTIPPKLMAGFGHNYYWVRSDSAKFIARALGFGVDLEIEHHNLPEATPLIERDNLEARTLAAWQGQFGTIAAGSPESAASSVPLDTRSSDLVTRLHARGDISDAQYDAARRFYAHWYLAGLGEHTEPRHPNFVARLVRVPVLREHEAYYSERHNEDLAHIGVTFSPIVRAVLLENRDPEGVGQLYLNRTGRRARESVIDIARACLDALTRHYS